MHGDVGGVVHREEEEEGNVVADLLSKGKVRIFGRVQFLIFIYDNY